MKIKIILITIISFVFLLILIIFINFKYYEYSRFDKHISLLKLKFLEIEKETGSIPENVKNIIIKIKNDEIKLNDSRMLIVNTKFKYYGMLDWHISTVYWPILINKIFNNNELITIYCYYMYFGDNIYGIKKGSLFLFHKNLDK